MSEFHELGPQTKQALSWIALGELLNIKHLKGSVGITRPGGGQYDCLNFFDGRGNPILAINRNGESVSGIHGKKEFQVTKFWETVSWNPRQAAQLIAKNISRPDFSEPDSERMVQALTVNRIAAWLLAHLDRSEYVRAEWAWYDSSYDVGVLGALDNFSIPDSWKNLPAPFPHEMWRNQGWVGNIFLLSKKDEFFCAVNLLSGEAINSDGSNWDRWPTLVSRGEGESVALAEIITVKFPDGEIITSSRVLPSERRRFIRNYSQEFMGVEFEFEPVFDLATDDYQDLILTWRLAEGYFPSSDNLRDYLD